MSLRGPLSDRLADTVAAHRNRNDICHYGGHDDGGQFEGGWREGAKASSHSLPSSKQTGRSTQWPLWKVTRTLSNLDPKQFYIHFE